MTAARATPLQTIYSELSYGLSLARCRECACLRRALDQVAAALNASPDPDAQALGLQAVDWLTALAEPQHDDLGCQPCYSKDGLNAAAAFLPAPPLDQRREDSAAGGLVWLDEQAPLGVLSLAGPELAHRLAERRPAGLALAGWFGDLALADALVKQALAHTPLRYLILAGCTAGCDCGAAALVAQAQHAAQAANRAALDPAGRFTPARRVQIVDLSAVANLPAIIEEIYALLLETLEASLVYSTG